MPPSPSQSDDPRPLIAITSDLMIRKDRPTAYLTMTYAQAVHNAGGIPVVLPPASADPERIADLISRFDAFILSGGDDPMTEPFGVPTHKSITPILPERQAFESELISQLHKLPEVPILGICLGLQMLALCSGGSLNQHLPDTHANHADHWDNTHPVNSTNESILSSGSVMSYHRQAITDPGRYQTLATAHDDVIEAIHDPNAKYRLAIQWHPERTDTPALGQAPFDQLIKATCS